MSTSPAPISPSNKSKINISMMLKLPIEIELEVMGIPPSQAQEIEENLNLNEKSEYQVVVSGMNLAKIEDSQTFLSQIVEQLQEENKLFLQSPKLSLRKITPPAWRKKFDTEG